MFKNLNSINLRNSARGIFGIDAKLGMVLAAALRVSIAIW